MLCASFIAHSNSGNPTKLTGPGELDRDIGLAQAASGALRPLDKQQTAGRQIAQLEISNLRGIAQTIQVCVHQRPPGGPIDVDECVGGTGHLTCIGAAGIGQGTHERRLPGTQIA